jgi:hypothetical protein
LSTSRSIRDYIVTRSGVLHCRFRAFQVLPEWDARIEGIWYPKWEESLAPAGRSVALSTGEPEIAFTLVVRGLKKVRLTCWDDESEWQFTDTHPVLVSYSSWQKLTIVRPSGGDLAALREVILSYPDDDEVRRCARWLATLAQTPPEDVIHIHLPEPVVARLIEECRTRGLSVLAGALTPKGTQLVTALVMNDDYVLAEGFEVEGE